MIQHEKLYYAFIQAHGVGSNDVVASSPHSYLSYLHSVVELTGKDITAQNLRTEAHIAERAMSIEGERAPKTIRNYCSAMRQYVSFINQAGL